MLINFSKKLLLCVVMVLPAYTAHLLAAPYIPQSDTEVLEQLPSSRDPLLQKLRQRQTQLAKSPEDLKRAIDLAQAYIQLGRTTTDPRYDGYAEAALYPWWNMTQAPTEVLILRATLRQRRHDFEGALNDLSRVLQDQPKHAQAWLLQSVIHQVQGNYLLAKQSCVALLQLSSPMLATACIANAINLNGRAQESYQALKKIIEQGIVDAKPQETGWALTILAEIAERLGKNEQADHYFQAALGIDRQDIYLLSAYSDFLLDQNRPQEVKTLLQQQTIKVDDLTDGLLLRLAIAEQDLNEASLEQSIATLKVRFANNRLRGDNQHLREEARFTLFLLQQPQNALQLALENWEMQREPWDARILLDAAIHSGNRAAAKSAINWLKSVNLEDVQLKNRMALLS